MERLHKLLFELSSVERLRIMSELSKSRFKLSQLSRKLNITVTEASRHLERLGEAKLIQKDEEGYFGIAPFGIVILTLLSGLGFASKHTEYLVDYDVSVVPPEFVQRIGELEGAVYASEALRNIEEGENKIREAREFVWILSDQILASTVPILAEKVKKPTKLRIVLPEGKFPPESESRLPLTVQAIEKRALPKVGVLIVLTEKFAVFCLPTRKGKLDYTGFSGTDPKFHAWCKDLFQHYWETAKPIVVPK